MEEWNELCSFHNATHAALATLQLAAVLMTAAQCMLMHRWKPYNSVYIKLRFASVRIRG